MSLLARARRTTQHHLRHRVDAELNLIPLIDILSVMVAFLLLYSAEVEVVQNTRGVEVPQSIVDGFGAPYSPAFVQAQLNRVWSDRHAARLIEAVRAGSLSAPSGTALAASGCQSAVYSAMTLPSRINRTRGVLVTP